MSDSTATQTSTLNRPWVLKMVIFMIAVFGFGTWGLYDAALKYPARGEAFAEWAELQYLRACAEANAEDFGYFLREASVPNPVAEFEHLSAPETKEANQRDADPANKSTRRQRAIAELARLQWLQGLKFIGHLSPEHTTIAEPRTRLEALTTAWSTRAQPTGLHSYDIPMQWGIMVVCYSIGVYMLVLFLRVTSRKYRWNPDEQRLTLPGGASITPDDLAEIDKRKWDKFIVFLRVREGHEQLGGQEVRIDTYRHARVEGWILEMERTAFPPEEDEDDDSPDTEPDAPVDDALDADGAEDERD